MVQCYLCKGKLRVTRDKHVYDEKLKKRYHFKCFAGICRECDMPVFSKSKHKVIGSNVWHEKCYKKVRARRRNPKYRQLKVPPPPPRERTLKLPPPPPWFRKLKVKNPRRPTKEFWDKVYPEVLADYEKKYPKAEAEERGRKATADIWYRKISPKKKAKYERIRRGRENPRRFLIFSGEKAPAIIFPKLVGEKYQLPEGWWIVEDNIKNRQILNEDRISFSRYSRPTSEEIVRAYDEQMRGNPRRPTKEFWQKTYPGVLEGYLKKYPKKEAEERAKKVTADIWYRQMSPGKKEKYERIRRKRESRENPTEPSWLETIEGDLELLKQTIEEGDISQAIEQVEGLEYGILKAIEQPGTKARKQWLETVEGDLPQLKETLESGELGPAIEQIEGLQWAMTKARENPLLVTPEQETDIVGAFYRVIKGIGTEADKALVRMAREADVIMSTGPSVMLKHNPEEPVAIFNPVKREVDYIIQDEFGTTFETGKGTEEQAEARALVYNKKYMRTFKVIYPKTESPEVKKAAQTAAKEMLKS